MQASIEDSGVPQRALDGSTAAAFNPDTCTLTKPERVPWWYVNLLEPYMVQLVRLDFGKPCCGVNKPAVIVVRVGNNRPDLGTNPICNRFTGFLEEGQPLFLPCNPPMPGAFVSVHLEASAPSQLSICEAFVYTDQALPIERCPQFRDQPPGSTATYNGKCYIFYDRQPADFREALAFCRSRGGSLVDESNPALQGFISWELWRRHRSDSSSQYWMGAVRDPQDPNNWKWVNGNDVTVSFWNAPGGGEGCARFDGSKGWLWADTECEAKLNYICQHQPKACGRPEQPPNSTMTTESFEVGAAVQYSCDPGHLLVGPTVRTCLDTGFYTEFPPVCKRIECGFPAEIVHGTYDLLNGSVSYLSHVQYACEGGYEMVGRSRLVCDIDERGAMRDASAARQRASVSVAQRVHIRCGGGVRMRTGVPPGGRATGLLPRQWTLGQAPAQVPSGGAVNNNHYNPSPASTYHPPFTHNHPPRSHYYSPCSSHPPARLTPSLSDAIRGARADAPTAPEDHRTANDEI
ncbi:hypothetical protein MSG28_001214 [Choristoneura fumiferana]|uniref:Uncharacterized protein n=1 Tax=Choristoneura fumiferana TaxID=7141 RepID=A0ACC0K475_CHOFU|nr:hypothetical protein MSG28_001214 [Choristoneura fumiferana]